jgi:hypothetical protein
MQVKPARASGLLAVAAMLAGCADTAPKFDSDPSAAPTMGQYEAAADTGLALQPAPGPQAGAPPGVDPWPRTINAGNASVRVFQPQVSSWTGNQLTFRVAVGLTPNGSAETFGVATGAARTEVDRTSRLVDLEDFGALTLKFPTLTDNGQSYAPQIRQAVTTALATVSLNRLETSLHASQTFAATPVAVNNTPPAIIVSYGPAILVPIDGTPVIKPIAGTRFERVINTQAMLARARFGATWYLHVYDGWLSAPAFGGPWTRALTPPVGLDDAADNLAAQKLVDLLRASNATPPPSLANGVPAIYVTQSPTELIIFKGQPNFVPVTGTSLLWASNTAADAFIDTVDNSYYVLISGRWYRARSLSGPWTFVAANALPADFAKIPKDSPAGAVLASVAGTPQAQEALIANSIPQSATISLASPPTFTPSFDGVPQYGQIQGTTLQYVVNSSTPIIASGASFYAVQAGVWFTATSLTGPWTVATSVPPAIYTIPAASPLHYVTYVRIYGATPEYVYVGYTPGYLGTVASPDGVVVYGTGYTYTPWIGSVWYPPPPTYGVAAAPVYNPAVGFTYGYGIGLATAAMAVPFWGGAYYAPGYYGYPCCGSASANVYRNWGTGVSSGTRTWYANPGGSFGTTASGTYDNRGTVGGYYGGRSYNPYTGQAKEGYDRTFFTPGGASGNVARGETYNAETGQRSYGSSVSATGAGGSTVNRSVAETGGPEGFGRTATTTTYNAKTGQTNTWTNGQPSDNNHYSSPDGNAYRSSASGWQQHGASGWQSAGSSDWADREQQARASAESRESAFSSGSGGWDRYGASDDRFGGDSWGNRFGGGGDDRFGGDSWGNRFGGGGDDRFGGGWGDRYGGSSFDDRFGGGGFGRGGFGGGRFGGFRR